MYVELKYNPYTVKTELSVNNEVLSDHSELLLPLNNQRIQTWIDDFFPKLIQHYRDNNIEISIYCTPEDAVDIESALHSFQQSPEGASCSISAKFHTKVQSQDEKISQLKQLIEDAKNGPFEEFKDEELQEKFEESLSPEFEVNVIATMSSGKSTVINSFIGRELMPAKNEACTATIAYITDNDSMNHFKGFCVNAAQEEVYREEEIKKEILEKWNSDEVVSTLYLEGNIKSIHETENSRLVLVDTPGANNSRDREHERKTYETIASKPLSMVLYVLNATQLNINDDAKLLEYVATTMNKGGRQAQDRFIFVANKIDAFDPEKGESVATALENVREYLSDKGITNPIIIPASANLAKLLRMKHDGEILTRSDRGFLQEKVSLFVEEDEMNMLKHAKRSLSRGVYARLHEKFNAANSDEAKAEILSGIPIIEELLNEFLHKHALPAKIKDAVDSLSHVIHKGACIESLTNILEQDEGKLQEIREKILQFRNDQDKITQAQEFRNKIKNATYEMHPELKESYHKVQREIDELKAHLTDDFEENVAPQKANRIIKRSIRECERVNNKIVTDIKEALDKNFIQTLKNYRDDYVKHIDDTLQRNFADEEQNDLREFQQKAFEIPSVDSLVQSEIYHDRVKVGSNTISDSKWYNPFSWGRKKTVYDYKNVELVDMFNVWEEVRESIEENSMKNIEAAKEHARVQAEKAKEVIIDALDHIDSQWDEMCSQIESASLSEQARDEEIKKNKEKLQWYEDFKGKLQKILDV